MEVSELMVKLAAAVAPNVTPVAVVKLHPAIVTEVPPLDAPCVGLMDVTAGVEPASTCKLADASIVPARGELSGSVTFTA
jgi:hypothetical protein